MTLYEKDFFQWVNDQAKFLRNEEFSKLDVENLTEEIENLGKSEKRILTSYLETYLMHVLKSDDQRKKTASWNLPVYEAFRKAKQCLTENPSLKRKFKDIVKDAYCSARIKVIIETNVDENCIPEKCPWDLNLKAVFFD